MSLDASLVALSGPLEDWLRERHERGQDKFDEVWDGVLHLAPAERPINGFVTGQLLTLLNVDAALFGLSGLSAANVGRQGDFRVPDALWMSRADVGEGTYAAAGDVHTVLETLSPGEDWQVKANWYAGRGIRRMLLADPNTKTLRSMDFSTPAGWVAVPWIFDPTGPETSAIASAIDW